MTVANRTLVIILSMHRSGSSLCTGILQAHGMSLGPFDLLGANAGNPHGYFEARPILDLSREVQQHAVGFLEDVPDTPESLARFLGTRGVWDDETTIPVKLLERGREIADSLIQSGSISGFKDPRTVLIWPFWLRVLEAFPAVRIVPIVLLRSPHEIAMSLFTRSESNHGYKTCLDVTAVHLSRLAAIVEGWPEPVSCVHFGGPSFEGDLARAVEGCGMSWNPEIGGLHFDPSCVHHEPATIAHEAQRIYESLCGEAVVRHDPAANLATLEADAFERESLYRRREDQNRAELEQFCHQLVEAENRLGHANQSTRRYQEGWQQLQELWDRTRAELEQTQDELRRNREALEQARHHWTGQVHDLTGQVHDLTEQVRDLTGQVEVARSEGDRLRVQLHRFDAHPVLGRVLRGRRRIKRMLRGIRTQHEPV